MMFARVGSVVSVEMVKDRNTGKHKGFAFVEMVSQSDAGKAVSEFNGQMLDRRRLNVKPAHNQEPKSSRRSGGYAEYISYNESIKNNNSFSSRQRNSR